MCLIYTSNMPYVYMRQKFHLVYIYTQMSRGHFTLQTIISPVVDSNCVHSCHSMSKLMTACHLHLNSFLNWFSLVLMLTVHLNP